MKLSEVTCEYVIKNGDVIPIENLRDDWDYFTNEEKRGWYTTKVERKKVNARDVLDYIFEDMEDDGYEEMAEQMWNMIDDKQIENLQKVLDDICDTDAADVYYADVLIDSK